MLKLTWLGSEIDSWYHSFIAKWSYFQSLWSVCDFEDKSGRQFGEIESHLSLRFSSAVWQNCKALFYFFQLKSFWTAFAPRTNVYENPFSFVSKRPTRDVSDYEIYWLYPCKECSSTICCSRNLYIIRVSSHWHLLTSRSKTICVLNRAAVQILAIHT